MLKWLVCWGLVEVDDGGGDRGAYKTNVNTGDTAAAVVLDGRDHLVDDLRGVRLGTSHNLQLVRPAFGVLARHTLKSYVRATAITHLLELGSDRSPTGQRREVDSLEPWLLRLAEIESPGTVAAINHDNTRCAVHERHMPSHLPNRSSAPHGHHIPFLNPRIHHAIPRRRQHIREIQRLLIRHVIRDLQQIHIPKRHARILGLPACEPAREMRVPEHARRAPAVHGVLDGVGVCALALRGLLLLAVVAFPAGDLEGGNDAVAGFPFGDGGADGVDFPAELVAEDVPFF